MIEFDVIFFLKFYVIVNGKKMVYYEFGSGDCMIVFLYGNLMLFYLWCNIILYVIGFGCCIVLDFIGQGDFDKFNDIGLESYCFVEYCEYFDGLFDVFDFGNDVVFVIYDWGLGFGFDWVNCYCDCVLGIVFMEVIVCLFMWEEWFDGVIEIFQGFCLLVGEDMVIDKNFFVEVVLFGLILCDLM